MLSWSHCQKVSLCRFSLNCWNWFTLIHFILFYSFGEQNLMMRIARKRLPKIRPKGRCLSLVVIQNQIYRIQRWAHFSLFFVSNNDYNFSELFLQQNFEHTVHVGFDAITGEFTVSLNAFFWIVKKCLLLLFCSRS